jgi:hypothetical protein
MSDTLGFALQFPSSLNKTAFQKGLEFKCKHMFKFLKFCNETFVPKIRPWSHLGSSTVGMADVQALVVGWVNRWVVLNKQPRDIKVSFLQCKTQCSPAIFGG